MSGETPTEKAVRALQVDYSSWSREKLEQTLRTEEAANYWLSYGISEWCSQATNLKACAKNVVSAWDNHSPGLEKWDRLRQKIEYLKEAL